jgi:hypothetical protein
MRAIAMDWDDWSQDGLYSYSVVVRSTVQMSLLLESNTPDGRRWTAEKRDWAVQWLSDPTGKAVPHV